jgi:20S proteasome subunit alpha 4
VRPFGISTLVIGFDQDGVARLYQTDPSGTYSAWKVNDSLSGFLVISFTNLSLSFFPSQQKPKKANATGRNSKTVREYLEKNYNPDATDEGVVKLAVRALLEVVESGSKNLEIAVMRRGRKLQFLEENEIEALVKQVEEEKAKEEPAPKTTPL